MDDGASQHIPHQILKVLAEYAVVVAQGVLVGLPIRYRYLGVEGKLHLGDGQHRLRRVNRHPPPSILLLGLGGLHQFAQPLTEDVLDAVEYLVNLAHR